MGYDMYIEGALPPPKNENDEPGYFRLNMFGMARYREYMDQLGMIVWDTNVRVGDIDVDAQPEAEPRGIPGYKLCSNDGWLVTPAEIRPALAVLEEKRDDIERVIDEGDREYWSSWVAYLARAEQNEGFRVH